MASGNGNGEIADLVVSRVHGAFAAVRKESNDLRRQKDLAQERLRLVKEERATVEKAVRGMEENLSQLKTGESDVDLVRLKQEVEQLHKEVMFQHGELLSKRQKFDAFKKSIDQDKKSFDEMLQDTQAIVRKQRQNVNREEQSALDPDNANAIALVVATEKIQQMLKLEIDKEEWWKETLPRILEQTAVERAERAGDFHRTNEVLKRILTGYERHFAENVDLKEPKSSPMEDSHQHLQ